MRQSGWMLLLALLIPVTGVGQSQKTYQVETTQVILDRDVVYARDVAFAKLRQALVYQGVLDLLGKPMYDFFQSSEYLQSKLSGARFLTSVQVLKEKREGARLFLSISGQLAIKDLADRLGQLNLVLKTDPSVAVTVLVEFPLVVAEPKLKERLSLFHVKVAQLQTVNLPEQTRRDQPIEIEHLFDEHPKAKVLLVIETNPKGPQTSQDSIQLRVFRKAGYRQLGLYSMTVGKVEPGDWPQVLENHQEGFLALFSLDSIQLASLSGGEQSMIDLEAIGLNTPLLRDQFESHVLNKKSEIRHFGLSGISAAGSHYQLQLRRGGEALLSMLKQTSPYFQIEILRSTASQIKVKVSPKFTRTVVPVKSFEPNESRLDGIVRLLGQDPESVIPNKWMPQLEEVEPNGNTQKVNQLNPGTLLFGRVSSRADEDIFEFMPKKGAKKLKIVWGRIGKTTLSPQFKLYDSEFNYLNQTNLLGTKKTVVRYQFQEAPTSPIFLRVADRVGFIQGETGGFKSFEYLISYTWE